MNKKGELIYFFMYTTMALLIAVLCIFTYINYNESLEACDNFGGKLSGNGNCVKNGVSYELETISLFSMKMQVVRKAVDIRESYVSGDKK